MEKKRLAAMHAEARRKAGWKEGNAARFTLVFFYEYCILVSSHIARLILYLPVILSNSFLGGFVASCYSR